MNDVRLHVTLAENGVLVVSGLPFKKGEALEVVVRRTYSPAASSPRRRLTGRTLAASGIVGLWQNRTDIGDTVEFARRIREGAQNRGRV